jgi:damage-control phosphatase, subfamily I
MKIGGWKMKSTSLCFPCFLKQAHSSAAFLTDDDAKRTWVLKEVAKMLPELDPEQNPAFNSSLVLLRVNELMGANDPYLQARISYDQMAMELLPRLRHEIDSAPDPLEMAVRLSAVGNIIDLGIKSEIDIEATMELAKGDGFKVFEMAEFKTALEKTKRILYILDNSGEIVFDMLLIEQLKKVGKMLIAAVRGGPILNDAVMDDAKLVGLDKVCKVIDTGSNFVGVIREKCSPIFLKGLDTADMVIAKGQGNYETLEGTRPNLFAILKAKCDAVSQHIGVQEGDLVFKRI